MVAIAERQKINNISNINIWNQDFYDNLDSIETLKRDLVLIKESEDMWGEIDAKDAYFEGLKFINNLKI